MNGRFSAVGGCLPEFRFVAQAFKEQLTNTPNQNLNEHRGDTEAAFRRRSNQTHKRDYPKV
jgi:hypothetical protein